LAEEHENDKQELKDELAQKHEEKMNAKSL
jgi:hypothetical protein